MMNDDGFVLIFLTAVFAFFMLKPLVWQLQSGGYTTLAIFSRIKFFWGMYFPYWLTGLCFTALYHLVEVFGARLAFLVPLAAMYFVGLITIIYFASKKTYKKNLVYTPRAVRLYISSWFLGVIVIILLSNLVSRAYDVYFGIFSFAAPMILPGIAYLTFLLLLPVERLNNLRYLRAARKKLMANSALIKIGITGSFGKTSVKNILKEMLSCRYEVVATRGNYNTPMGIAKSAGKITPYTDVFIAEMGARHKGDIEKLVSLVSPRFGILTGVTGQHLETFGTVENIYAEKLSLLKALPPDGFGVANAAGTDGRPLPENCVYAGVDGTKCYAHSEVVTASGTEFCLNIGGRDYKTKTRLLGRHNLENIAVAAAMATRLGATPDEIIKAVACLTPVPHRLENVSMSEVTVIDDTYNANPKGVREALEVLKCFPGRKTVITPGMVELGEAERAENILFGREIAVVADFAILIGTRACRDVYEGLKLSGFPEEKIMRFMRLSDAEREFSRLFKAGDTVMFINDLPDELEKEAL